VDWVGWMEEPERSERGLDKRVGDMLWACWRVCWNVWYVPSYSEYLKRGFWVAGWSKWTNFADFSSRLRGERFELGKNENLKRHHTLCVRWLGCWRSIGRIRCSRYLR
jgi:hypothetical protein